MALIRRRRRAAPPSASLPQAGEEPRSGDRHDPWSAPLSETSREQRADAGAGEWTPPPLASPRGAEPDSAGDTSVWLPGALGSEPPPDAAPESQSAPAAAEFPPRPAPREPDRAWAEVETPGQFAGRLVVVAAVIAVSAVLAVAPLFVTRRDRCTGPHGRPETHWSLVAPFSQPDRKSGCTYESGARVLLKGIGLE